MTRMPTAASRENGASPAVDGDDDHRAYWEEFYARKADAVPADPSAFARWVVGRLPRCTVLEIGSGTGRDSLFFAAEGYTVLGCDYAVPGLRYAEDQARRRGLDRVTFQQLDLYDDEHVLERADAIAGSTAPDAVYARFMVHAVSDEGRHNLFRLAGHVLGERRGQLFLEFRTARADHEFGEHFRQFVQPAQVEEELRSYGLEVEHCEEGFGLAVHKNEDPKVCRIVARAKG
ncbi:SAM-dependent methyltransferase [Nocardioides caldifontis]|uniref:SAM-dependent methyltransferase n=1 Tax=Nocardioides caldifontis TaxID=2588938 RepID=UPI0011DF052C|nr:class I SAM-dependent methyltransferase [Nocardioides caldifontis]